MAQFNLNRSPDIFLLVDTLLIDKHRPQLRNANVLTKELLIYQRLRRHLARPQAPLLLGLLGLFSGLLAGGVIIMFRLLVEYTQKSILPAGGENYEGLDLLSRLSLPIAGAILITIIWYLASVKTRLSLGVVHVLERLAYHEGHLPLKNALLQFIGAGIAIISGFSVGREGPSIHLGAAAASLMGQRLTLPNNSIRTLVACGTAAAIAASFNTPLAGVIFAMEVVMMEYTIAGFTPVIMAAVGATALSRAVYGAEVAFIVPQLEMNSLWELPYITFMGVVVGLLSVCFIRLLRRVTHAGLNFPLWQRLLLAGLGVGLIGQIFPEVMGIGYDTVNDVLLGKVGLWFLLIIIFAKLLATVISVGMGVPAGLIGPTLFIGACAGGAMGILGSTNSTLAAEPGFYAMLGMGAMMSATLQAPLAALLALLELTGNANIILPGMLAVVSANLTTKGLFGNGSVFMSQMREMGMDYQNDPVTQAQARIGVTAVMQESFVVSEKKISRQRAKNLLSSDPIWIITEQSERKVLFPAVDLLRFLNESDIEQIDLLEIPSQRQQLAAVSQQSTVRQALKILKEQDADALYVMRKIGPAADQIFGVITRRDLDNSYQLSQT
jgi:H+/Cl- antiporter ClcA